MRIFACFDLAMDLTNRLQQVCRVVLPTVENPAIKDELQVCAEWVEKFGINNITIATLIEVCVCKLRGDIQQPIRELLLDLLKLLYREQEKLQAEQSTATIEEGLPTYMPPALDEQTLDEVVAVLKMTNQEWTEAWQENVRQVEKLRDSYKRFKAGVIAATARTQELAQRPNPPESTEKIEQALEDVAAEIVSFTTTITIKKQQREEQRRKAALQAAQKAARATVLAAQKARSECERQCQLAREELVRVGLNPDEVIYGKELHCYFCGLQGYRARCCPRRADHSQYRRAETLYGTRWIRTFTPK